MPLVSTWPRDGMGRLIYPETDGQPVGNNTKHLDWIVFLREGMKAHYKSQADKVFVAADLFWYPVEGRPDIVVAPDVIVAFGRPQGDRPSYKQWEEENIAPQAVFEVLSPSNKKVEMEDKLKFFETHGAKEYYIYDSAANHLVIHVRGEGGRFRKIDVEVGSGWSSSLFELRFEVDEEKGLRVHNDVEFRAPHEWHSIASEAALRAKVESERAEAEAQRAEAEAERAEAEAERADSAEERAQQLQEKLRELGVDPDSL